MVSNFILIVLIKFRAPINLEYYNYNKLIINKFYFA